MNKYIDDLIIKLVNDIGTKCDSNEIPVGAMVIDKQGNVISECFNNRQGNCNVLGHAEILAIQEAEQCIGDWRLDGYDLIVSLKPCDMCSFVIRESRIDNVYYLLDKSELGKYIDLYSNFIEIINNNEIKSKYNKLLTDFFVNKR